MGYTAIWDTGGVDTIRYDGVTDAVIDLRPATLLNDFGGGGFVSGSRQNFNGYTIAAGVVIENAIGGQGVNTITGNDADNHIVGGPLFDTLKGGAGDDTVEGGGERGDWMEGGPGDDVIIGRYWLDGGPGADRLVGGEALNIFHVDDSGDVIVHTHTPLVRDEVRISNIADYVMPETIEVLRVRSGVTNVMGNELDNEILIEAGGFHRIDGGPGADIVHGGPGDDLVLLVDAADSADLSFSGYDIVEMYTNHHAGASGAGEYRLLGSANLLIYEEVRDRLQPALKVFANDALPTTINTGGELYGGASNDTLTGLRRADLLFGGGGNDKLFGNNGADVLDGGPGRDIMDGGAHDDTYHVDNLLDMVIEAFPKGGIDHVISSVRWTLGANVENLTLTGVANIYGIGNNLDNVIIGNDGENILDGKGGNDTLIGGAGFDTLIGGSAVASTGPVSGNALIGGAGNDRYIVTLLPGGDTIIEHPNEGIDTVRAEFGFVLPLNVEYLTLTGAGDYDGTRQRARESHRRQ
jgi:Ca2+-binding RTX toxin-like protein